ncbi:MAG TPA: undecaprenyl-phosphate glucose phosphotransferase [Methylovirgula sp.]
MVKFTAHDFDKLAVANDQAIDKPQSDDATERQIRVAALADTMYCAPANSLFSPTVLEGLLRFVEFTLVTIAGFGLYLLTVTPERGFEWPSLILIPALAAGVVLTLQALGLYRLGAFRALRSQALRLAGGIAVVCLAALLTSFILSFDAETARPFLLDWFAATLVTVLITRVLLSLFVARLSRTGRLNRRTVLVGGGAAANDLLHNLANPPQTDLEILGIFDDRADDRSPAKVGEFRKLGTVDDLIEFARRTRVDLIIFTLPISAENRILQMLRRLWILPIDIRLAAHMSKLRFHERSYSYIGAVPLIDIFERPLADWDLVLKLCFDKIVGAFCLLLLAPVMLLVALAVKIDSKGPALFKQKRYGFNNELIEVYKFRSMYVESLDQTAAKLVTRGDPRVTRVGRFIRKTSLDELPQLFNVVFKGNLSLVGPRPHAVHAKAAEQLYDAVVDGYFARHRVRPGLTGWAQINGWRGETDTQEKIQHRVEHDLHYIENWSILFDLYILLKTPYALLKSDNAY